VRDDYAVFAPPPRRRFFVLFLVTASIAVILVATGILFGWAISTTPGPSTSPPAAAAARSPSPKRPTPQAVTQKYLEALAAGDAKAGDAQVCSLLRGKTPSELNLPFSLGDLVTFEASAGAVKGKTATVPAKVSVPVLGSTNFTVYLVDEEGAWKVCGIG
jgi:hypothetical protein